MKTILHTANSRGKADHGWLNSHHSFSFGHYYDPERMGFGALRVINDDQVSGDMGFDTHPHENMEIISLPLEGDLKHKDSMGNEAIIKQGDIQIMSAGTGVFHSEYNHNPDKPVKFLQIWVVPNKQGVEPRYDQKSLADIVQKDQFSQILSPNKDEDGVWAHQNAWFHFGDLSAGTKVEYSLKDPKNNGVYAFILDGDVTVADQDVHKRDGVGITDTETFGVEAKTDAKVLLMEVPWLD